AGKCALDASSRLTCRSGRRGPARCSLAALLVRTITPAWRVLRLAALGKCLRILGVELRTHAPAARPGRPALSGRSLAPAGCSSGMGCSSVGLGVARLHAAEAGGHVDHQPRPAD